MVSKKPHHRTDRPRGVLNNRYRKYLLDESDVEPASQASRDIRSEIRRNLYHSLLDFILIYQHVEQRDIDMSLRNLDGEERLSRDEAIVNAIALFLDLGSGEEIADLSGFERYVELAAILAWRDRHGTSEDSGVWLGEPSADLTVEWPDRVDAEELADKVGIISARITLADQEGIPKGETLGSWMQLDLLSSDEVIFLNSVLALEQHNIGEGVRDDPSALDPIKAVVQTWLVWWQQRWGNFSDDSLDQIAAKYQIAMSQFVERLEDDTDEE